MIGRRYFIHYTGKERDAESGNDYFGARYYASSLGRFVTPDWDGKPVTVPYASFGDPQTLNLYSYVENGPVNKVDADGHAANAGLGPAETLFNIPTAFNDPTTYGFGLGELSNEAAQYAYEETLYDDATQVNAQQQGQAQQQSVPPPPPPPAPAPVFRNPNEAAMNAAAGITGAMQATGNEYGAALYKTSNGMIGVTPLRTDGKPDTVGTSDFYTGKDIPAGATRIGDIHGHPDGSGMSGDTGDRGVAFMELKAHGTETQYMVNLKGEVRKFNPATDRVPSVLPGRIQ